MHYGSVEVAYEPFYNCGLVSQPLSECEAFSPVTVKWAIHFIETFFYKMTTAKSCCFIQDKNIDINNKNGKEKSDLTFPDISYGQAVLL